MESCDMIKIHSSQFYATFYLNDMSVPIEQVF